MCKGNKRFILEIPTSQQIILILKFILTSALNIFLAFYQVSYINNTIIHLLHNSSTAIKAREKLIQAKANFKPMPGKSHDTLPNQARAGKKKLELSHF